MSARPLQPSCKRCWGSGIHRAGFRRAGPWVRCSCGRQLDSEAEGKLAAQERLRERLADVRGGKW